MITAGHRTRVKHREGVFEKLSSRHLKHLSDKEITPCKSAVWVPTAQMRIFLMALLDAMPRRELMLIQTFRITLI